MHKLLKKGNAKVNGNTLLFNLPTRVCGFTCDGCYAKKAELRFPAALAYRNENHRLSLHHEFVIRTNREIETSKRNIVRIHESGDFYSQEYISKWKLIAEQNPDVKFYAYTKKRIMYDFSGLDSLPNVNVINSLTPLGLNYGNQEHCNRLANEHGYFICPCKKGVTVSCMKDCQVCLTNKKVCFLKH